MHVLSTVTARIKETKFSLHRALPEKRQTFGMMSKDLDTTPG